MSGASVVDRERFSGQKHERGYALLLLFFFILGASLRTLVAYNGGIWADEGFFLRVVRTPSWTAMIDFLRFHESHPPLFYALMRVWMEAFGSSDRVALILPIALGSAIVPFVYACGARVFSRRAAIIGALLVAICPALVEFSGQFRPYGLLPVLALTSCWSLAEAISSGTRKAWVGYVISTLILVYTHHWSWLIVIGQVVAVLAVRLFESGELRRRVWRELAVAWTAIVVGYLPWLQTFLYQIKHAGHPPFTIEAGNPLVVSLLEIPACFVMMFVGTDSTGATALTVGSIVLFVSLPLFAWINRTQWSLSHSCRQQPTSDSTTRVARLIFIVVLFACVLLVAGLSWRTSLLLPRCLAMLSPLVLLLVADWISRRSVVTQASFRRWTQISPVGLCVLLGLIALSALGQVYLFRTTRSNAREVARTVTQRVRPTDLVIVVPVWYSGSFDHYFAAPVQEIVYPGGRNELVDFSDVFTRLADPEPVGNFEDSVAAARLAGRRVWLVSGRASMRFVTASDSAAAFRGHQSSVLSTLRLQEIRKVLESNFGPPDTSAFVGGNKPRYDELLPFLYCAPVSASRLPNTDRKKS